VDLQGIDYHDLTGLAMGSVCLGTVQPNRICRINGHGEHRGLLYKSKISKCEPNKCHIVPLAYTFTILDWQKAREDWNLPDTSLERLTRLVEARLGYGVVDGIEVEVDDVPD
jgi:hypothetical protein